jgi:hypothetical protein
MSAFAKSKTFIRSQKRPDTVAQFILDEINSTKSLEFADLFFIFNDAFELGNSIGSFSVLFESNCFALTSIGRMKDGHLTSVEVRRSSA